MPPKLPMDIDEKEISLLKYLQDAEAQAGQRDFASKLGLSLGMTNTILKRFVEKGWVLIKKVTPKKFQYALTPEGIQVLTKQSFRYLKKTMKSVAIYRETLEIMVEDIKAQGYLGVVLEEPGDVGFIIEALCQKTGLGYTNQGPKEKYFTLVMDQTDGD